jgi:hypothetical protein
MQSFSCFVPPPFSLLTFISLSISDLVLLSIFQSKNGAFNRWWWRVCLVKLEKSWLNKVSSEPTATITKRNSFKAWCPRLHCRCVFVDLTVELACLYKIDISIWTRACLNMYCYEIIRLYWEFQCQTDIGIANSVERREFQ